MPIEESGSRKENYALAAKKQTSDHPEENKDNAFFSREANLINDFAQGLGVNFKPGSGWGVNPDTGETTYDTKFFTEQGYTYGQSIFASCHEIDHIKEFAQLRSTEEGRQFYKRCREAAKKERRRHILENCLLDVADNRRVVGQLPALDQDRETLYREKLWPSSDFTGDPRHLQFAYSILRSSMLPSEAVKVAPEVEQALERLRHVKGRSGSERNIIDIVTDPALDPLTKFKLVEKYIEPVYEKLFEEDKKDKQQQQKSQGGKGQRESGNPEDSFADDYDDYDSKNPQPLSPGDIEKAAEVARKQDGSDIGGRQNAGYEQEHGVAQKEIADYYTEYKIIEQYIEPMRAQFRRIVSERVEPYRKLVGFFDEGIMIEPGLVGQALTDFSKGISDPMVFRNFEGRIRRKEVPSVFEATGVFDRSGSMDMDGGEKKKEQRRAAILLMEALREFMELPEVRDNLLEPNLRTLSEIRSFGSSAQNVEIKPLSSELTEKTRIETFKTLGSCPGGATEDYVSLGQIVDGMKAKEKVEPGYLDRVKSRAIKKLVIIFSDGGSSNESQFQQKKTELENMGVKVVNYRRIVDGSNFTSQMARILGQAIDELSYNNNSREENRG